MLQHDHLHFNYLHILKNKLFEVYLYHTIEWFAISLISIFIPIYLLTLGYSLSQVLLFYIVNNISILISYFIAAMVSTRYGLKHTAFLNLPFLITTLLALYALEFVAIPIYLIAIVSGIHVAFRWLPLNSLFGKYSHKKKRNFEVAKLFAFPAAASIFGPLIGGSIIFLFGFGVLFSVVVFLLLLSFVPLFFTNDIKPHVKFSIKKFRFYFKTDMKYFIGITLFFMRNSFEFIIWPIFIFLSLNNIISIGIIGAAFAGGRVLFNLFVGKISDKVRANSLFKIGAILIALVWFWRINVSDPIIIYFLTFLSGLFIVLHNIPLTTMTFDKANKTNRDAFLIFREFGVNIGRIIALLIALIFINNFSVGFSLAGFSSLFFLIF